MNAVAWKNVTILEGKSACSFYSFFPVNNRRNLLRKLCINALDVSHLVHAHGLLNGLPMTKLKSLQTVENSAARLIVRDGTLSVEEAKFSFHLLPIVQRIRFKILLVIHLHIPGRSGLRSSGRTLDVAVSVKREKKKSARAEQYLNCFFFQKSHLRNASN